MSVEATAWVLRHRVGDTVAKVILWGIADHADRYGTNAYPSQETLAEYAEVTRQTVNNKIKWLAEHGWIEVQHRSSREGRKTNCYTILGMQLSEAPSQPLSRPPLQPLSQKEPQLSQTAALHEPSVENHPSSEPTAPPREDAGGVRALVAHFYDEATRLRMTVPQSMAPHIARQITDALAAGAPERDVKGGITLLLEKGRPPQSLPYLVAEWQATRRPVTREEKPHWDEEPYAPVLPPDEQLEAVRRLQQRLSGAPTADGRTSGKDPPAATTKTSSPSTPTLEENPNEHDPEHER